MSYHGYVYDEAIGIWRKRTGAEFLIATPPTHSDLMDVSHEEWNAKYTVEMTGDGVVNYPINSLGAYGGSAGYVELDARTTGIGVIKALGFTNTATFTAYWPGPALGQGWVVLAARWQGFNPSNAVDWGWSVGFGSGAAAVGRPSASGSAVEVDWHPVWGYALRTVETAGGGAEQFQPFTGTPLTQVGWSTNRTIWVFFQFDNAMQLKACIRSVEGLEIFTPSINATKLNTRTLVPWAYVNQAQRMFVDGFYAWTAQSLGMPLDSSPPF